MTLEKQLPNCDKEVWEKGEHIGTIIDLKPEEIEKIIRATAKKSGQRVDWHYFGGRAVVKVLGDVDKARNYLRAELENEWVRGYSLT